MGKTLEEIDEELSTSRVHHDEESCCGSLKRRSSSVKYQRVEQWHGCGVTKEQQQRPHHWGAPAAAGTGVLRELLAADRTGEPERGPRAVEAEVRVIHGLAGGQSGLVVVAQQLVQEVQRLWADQVLVLTVDKALPPLTRGKKKLRPLPVACDQSGKLCGCDQSGKL
ncbi:hypothetical protein N1851_031585 [Merluccius polli]|uniref:Uncharacterized protein n=1 Tax=Merluccius polli TaxID=89951 RepID=A0AA47M3S0_MERPO|nr:hypothetical protein N1851_031585 [Merluccius polli]